ncbi:hypothetical protein M3J09_012290 [Ascochyta lentis]
MSEGVRIWEVGGVGDGEMGSDGWGDWGEWE